MSRKAERLANPAAGNVHVSRQSPIAASRVILRLPANCGGCNIQYTTRRSTYHFFILIHSTGPQGATRSAEFATTEPLLRRPFRSAELYAASSTENSAVPSEMRSRPPPARRCALNERVIRQSWPADISPNHAVSFHPFACPRRYFQSSSGSQGQVQSSSRWAAVHSLCRALLHSTSSCRFASELPLPSYSPPL